MRIIFAILGILAVCFGCLGFVFGAQDHSYLWIGRFGGGGCFLSGIVLIIAAMNKYRGHWALVVGLGLISFALFGLGSELDDAAAGKSRGLTEGISLACSVTIFGILSLSSAHKLHECTEQVS